MRLENFDFRLEDGEDEYSPPRLLMNVEGFNYDELTPAANSKPWESTLVIANNDECRMNVLKVSTNEALTIPTDSEIIEAAKIFNENLKENWYSVLSESLNYIKDVAEEAIETAMIRKQDALIALEQLKLS